MKRLTEEVVHFFHRQNFAIVSTVDAKKHPHNSCKGIVKINRNGRVYLLDLYKGRTFANLKRNPSISITAVDEHRFKGYCLKGKAKITEKEKLKPGIIKVWEKRLNSRITQRILRNIRGEKGHRRHPEALLPQPQYLFVMETEGVVDLTPGHLR